MSTPASPRSRAATSAARARRVALRRSSCRSERRRELGARSASTTSATRWPPPRPSLAMGVDRRGGPRRPAQLRRRPAPARAGGRDRRRPLRQRLQGDQRRRRGRGDRLLRRWRARDPRRLAQGRLVVRGPRAAGRRALHRLLPDRRGGGAPARRPRADAMAGVQLHRCGDLEAAVHAAAAAAEPGDVVLLAPACASFDAYRDYEERGEHFRELVEAMAMRAPATPPQARARAPGRVLDAAHGDPLPARLRRRHGLQRQLDHVAARRVRRRRATTSSAP